MTTIRVYYKGKWETLVLIKGGVPDDAIIDMAMAIYADPLIPHENVAVVDQTDGEVLWDICSAAGDDEPADIDSDVGFDPYMGCFSDGC
jgi:hypothetical protein